MKSTARKVRVMSRWVSVMERPFSARIGAKPLMRRQAILVELEMFRFYAEITEAAEVTKCYSLRSPRALR